MEAFIITYGEDQYILCHTPDEVKAQIASLIKDGDASEDDIGLYKATELTYMVAIKAVQVDLIEKEGNNA